MSTYTPPPADGGGGADGADMGLDVYDLSADALGTHSAGFYAIDQDGNGNIVLIPVTEDTSTTDVLDDFIQIIGPQPIVLDTLDDQTKSELMDGSWDPASSGSAYVGVAYLG